MDKNIKIVKMLSELNQKWFTEAELKKWGVYPQVGDLYRKRLLDTNHTNDKFFLTETAYTVILAYETRNISEDTRRLTLVMIGFTVVLEILTAIQISLALEHKDINLEFFVIIPLIVLSNLAIILISFKPRISNFFFRIYFPLQSQLRKILKEVKKQLGC